MLAVIQQNVLLCFELLFKFIKHFVPFSKSMPFYSDMQQSDKFIGTFINIRQMHSNLC